LQLIHALCSVHVPFRKAKGSPEVLGVRKKEPNHPIVA
jgi:hypothetical protein